MLQAWRVSLSVAWAAFCRQASIPKKQIGKRLPALAIPSICIHP